MKPSQLKALRYMIREAIDDTKSAKLRDRLNKVIPDNTSVIDFANAIGSILKTEYGDHNYAIFLKTLKQSLKDE